MLQDCAGWVEGAVNVRCVVEKLLTPKTVTDYPALKAKARYLIVACREYFRLAHSYGDGSASSQSFYQRGGEGAWLDLDSLENASLKDVAKMVNPESAAAKNEENCEDSERIELKTVLSLARDTRWKDAELDRMMFK